MITSGKADSSRRKRVMEQSPWLGSEDKFVFSATCSLRGFEEVGRVEFAGGRVDFVVSVVESELFEDSGGSCVIGMMAGEQSLRSKRVESVGNHGATCFGRDSFAPMRGKEMEAEFGDSLIDFVGTQAATSGEFTIREKEDGPILNLMNALRFDFAREARMYVLGRKGPAKKKGDS